jgi:hypothetical protein
MSQILLYHYIKYNILVIGTENINVTLFQRGFMLRRTTSIHWKFYTRYFFVNSKNKIGSLVKFHFIITKKQLLIEK